jgi:hypothetical protein
MSLSGMGRGLNIFNTHFSPRKKLEILVVKEFDQF